MHVLLNKAKRVKRGHSEVLASPLSLSLSRMRFIKQTQVFMAQNGMSVSVPELFFYRYIHLIALQHSKFKQRALNYTHIHLFSPEWGSESIVLFPVVTRSRIFVKNKSGKNKKHTKKTNSHLVLLALYVCGVKSHSKFSVVNCFQKLF